MCTRSPEYARPNRPHQRARLPFTGPYVIPNHPQILATMQKKKAKNKNKKILNSRTTMPAKSSGSTRPTRSGSQIPRAGAGRERPAVPATKQIWARLLTAPGKIQTKKTGGTTRRCSHPSRNSAAGSNRGNMSVKAKSS